MKTCAALIVAAGSGQRFGGSIPKQYQPLAGISILRRSIMAFLNHPHITSVHVVINPAHRAMYDAAVQGLDLPTPIEGGKTRQESVRNGLLALKESAQPDYVMIHDAARPFIDAKTISAVRQALDTHDGVLAARPVVDTLKRASGDKVSGTVDRSELWQAYTPQSFQFDAIYNAHIKAAASPDIVLTDDAAVAENTGIPVTLVLSNPENMKITNPEDMDRAARLLGQGYNDIRTGMGFDVHRYEPGDAIILGGVRIPHNRKLEGHSDADAVLHALTDALLGGMGLGDIGKFFPPSDPQWKGCDSAVFVRAAVQKLSEHGGLISNTDITLVCEAPKIGPHRDAMQARIAELLEIAPERVNVKATTTERLGFTGREEGLAAHAIVTLRFPG